MRILERPGLQEALEVIKEALRKGYVLVLAGRCSVDYTGRASSRLGLGDRVVIYKPDGSLLVHRPTGYEPVNWMPAGSYLTASNEGGLCLRALRRKPFEELRVTFKQVYFAAAGLLVDEEEFFLYATEEEMRKAVELKPSLIEPGFKLYSREKRLQLTGGEGFADLVGEDEEGNLVVLELKRGKVDRGAVLQLKHYVEALKAKTPRKVRGVLVGPSITKEASTLAKSMGFDYRRLDPKECSQVLREAKVELSLLDFTSSPKPCSPPSN